VEVRPIAADVARSVVCVSVYVLGTLQEDNTKTAELQVSRFGGWTRVGPWNHALDGSPAAPREGHLWGMLGRCNVPPDECIAFTTVSVDRRCGLLQYNTIQYKICKAPCCRGFRGAGEQLPSYVGHLLLLCTDCSDTVAKTLQGNFT